MIKELKDWFKHHQVNDKYNRDDTTLQKAFAIVINHVIKANNVETTGERKQFTAFFKYAFDLDDARIRELHDKASQFDSEFEAYLDVLKDELKDAPAIKLRLMQTIDNVLQSGTFDSRELEAFEQVRKALYG